MTVVVLSASELADLIKQNVREALAEQIPTASPSNKPLNVNEAATYLGLPKATLYQLTSTREIPHKKVGKRLVFLIKELDEWVESKHKKTHREINFQSSLRTKKGGVK